MIAYIEQYCLVLNNIILCKHNTKDTQTIYHSMYSKTCLQGTLWREDTLYSGEQFFRKVSCLLHVKESDTEGHLSCKGHSTGKQCPLKTGFIVFVKMKK